MKLTAVFQKVPEGYIAFIEEVPGVNTQGITLEDARENLKEALKLVMESNRQLAEESISNQDVIREPFNLSLSFRKKNSSVTFLNMVVNFFGKAAIMKFISIVLLARFLQSPGITRSLIN